MILTPLSPFESGWEYNMKLEYINIVFKKDYHGLNKTICWWKKNKIYIAKPYSFDEDLEIEIIDLESELVHSMLMRYKNLLPHIYTLHDFL